MSDAPVPPIPVVTGKVTKRRKLARMLKPISDGIVFVLKLLPRKVAKTLYRSVENVPGVVGVVLRMCYAKRLAKSCGDNVIIGVGCEMRSWDKLELGNNVSIQRGCWIDACGGMVIGDNVSIATQCVMVSFDHQWSDETLAIRDNKAIFAPIVLEGDIWLGAGAKVMKGVTIGRRSIVAAGAVVNKDVPARSIVGGVPGKVLKTI